MPVAEAGHPWAELADVVLAANAELPWLIAYPDLPETPEVAGFRDHYAWADRWQRTPAAPPSDPDG